MFFWIESSKKFHAKRLIVRCFMITSLFKNNALLQQFLISIEPVKWDMFYKKWCEKTNIKIGSYHRFQTSTTFANLCEHFAIRMSWKRSCKSFVLWRQKNILLLTWIGCLVLFTKYKRGLELGSGSYFLHKFSFKNLLM